MVTVKRIDLIVDTLICLEQMYGKSLPNEITWVHFGDGQLLKEIKKKVDSNLKYIKVIFKGQVANSEVLKFFQNNEVDLFINVSMSEGLPVSIMEAISFGIPIIATNVGGTREVVEDLVNGYLLNRNSSPKNIAETVFRFVENRELVARMGVSSRSMWEKKFNAIYNYEKFTNTFLINKL